MSALPRMRVTWRLLIAATGVTVCALAVFIAAGAPTVSAATGHLTVTRWLLQFAKARSIAVRAARITPPDLSDQALVRRGAGAYETMCRQCHGEPGIGAPASLRLMLPQPPDLLRVRERRRPAELFQIVKEGIKLSGMPAWPAQRREDEVWAMVAFLDALPRAGTDGYRRLAAGITTKDPSAPPVVVRSCARCHGADGLADDRGAAPKLAGQRFDYLYRALRAFQDGTRLSGLMTPVVDGLTDDEMRVAAEYFASLEGLTTVPPSGPAPSSAGSAPPLAGPAASQDNSAGIGASALRAAGNTLVHEGDPARHVAACRACHLVDDVNQAFPRLGGQHRNYLALQLQLFTEGRRGGSSFAPIMHAAAAGLTGEQRRQAAAFFEGDGRE